MASDDSEDSFLAGTEQEFEPLTDDYVPPMDIVPGDVKVQQDCAAAASRPSDVPKNLVGSAHNLSLTGDIDQSAQASSGVNTCPEHGEIDAKNIVIASLKTKLRQCKCQATRTSSRENYDDAKSSVTSPILPGLSNGYQSRSGNTTMTSPLTIASGSRVNSSEAETSNSTDAEKLATTTTMFSGALATVKERDVLVDRNEQLNEQVHQLKENLAHEIQLNKDHSKLYDELQSKYYICTEQLESTSIARARSHHELKGLTEVKDENERFRKNEQRLRAKLQDIEKEKEILQEIVDKTKSESLVTMPFNHGMEEVSLLKQSVDVLCRELQETAQTVKRQNNTIRRLRNLTAAAKGRKDRFTGKEEEVSAPSFRSRGHSNSPVDVSLNAPIVASLPTLVSDNVQTSPAKAQRKSFIPMTDPSDEDMYGASSPSMIRLRNHGPFDLDSYEESIMQHGSSTSRLHEYYKHSAPGISKPLLPPNYPLKAASQSQPLDYPLSSSRSQQQQQQQQQQQRHPLSQTRPFNGPPSPVYPPSRLMEQSDDSDEQICPVCSKKQPRGSTIDELQVHVMSCLSMQEDSDDRMVLEDSKAQPRNDSVDKICPICSALFPPDSPQQEFEEHVNKHFDTDYAMVNREEGDGFGTPQIN